jgi:tRNA threonylcarbamoyladenosine biosynthesis protein TsaE
MSVCIDDSLVLYLPDQAATEALAERLAPHMRGGDVVLLSGDVGAGKSSFARAVIRTRLGANTEVPSPTYTLVQVYDDDQTPIWHVDLYRIRVEGEVHELGLVDVMDHAVCLIEWPERAMRLWPVTALHLAFAPKDDGRSVTVSGKSHLLAWLAPHG